MKARARNAVTLAGLLLAPPMILLLTAHSTDLLRGGLYYGVLLVIWMVGIFTIVLSRWQEKTKLIVGLAYTALFPFVLPVLTLLAVCTTGDCV